MARVTIEDPQGAPTCAAGTGRIRDAGHYESPRPGAGVMVMRRLLAPNSAASRAAAAAPGIRCHFTSWPALPVAGGACIVERASAYGPSVGCSHSGMRHSRRSTRTIKFSLAVATLGGGGPSPSPSRVASSYIQCSHWRTDFACAATDQAARTAPRAALRGMLHRAF